MSQKNGRTAQAGFTLLELMVVLLILSVIIGAVFQQMNVAQQRLSTEEIKLDDFQQARDFVDQFFRDINQIGTPNARMFDDSQVASFVPTLALRSVTNTWSYQYINDNRFAVGLVYIDANEIRFEGSVNGTGTVQSVIYKINGSGGCQYCMMRSQVDKAYNVDPLTGPTPNWGTEVNDIISTPIFRYFQYDGTEITTASSPLSLPAGISTSAGAQALANVKTIQINLTIRNPQVLDKKTGQPIETSFEGEISLNNCSLAASSQPMSCF